jgi:class 3 adenylate cyclase/tetratricopeptide (TPR) repeat protein
VTNAVQPTQVPAGTEVRTFLIADVRGYTSFTLEHGDQAAAGLATRFAEVADTAVRARDGNVIELRGDEALAVFTSARQALRAAVDLQSGFAAERDVPLKVGIGLDAGEAIPVGAGFRGAALNLAARLCSLAGPGEILASDTVANLARKMDGLEYADRGAVQLKGFTDPVNVVIVKPSTGASSQPVSDQQQHPEGDQVEVPGLPIGGYLGSLPTNPLVGREVELARVLSLAEGAANGAGKLVVFAGEPGVGKTRLAQEVTLHVRNAGFSIAAGRCYEPQQAVPFYPFVDALAGAYAAAPSSLQQQVPARWADLARLLPSLGLPHTDHSGSQDQQRLYWEVTSFLQALAAEGPLALLVDDLHWADAASLDLLLHLARHTGSDRVLLLGTYRDVEVNRQHPLEGALRDLQREDLVERIPIRRLQQSNTAALMAATMGEERVSDEFASLVFRRTEGNPFFVQQVMRMLVERGDVYQEGDHWERKAVEEIDVPESIRSVVGQRLSRLTEETQELLREASVLGQSFFFDDLEAMTERSEREVEEGLEEAARAGLIREINHDRYAFDHALTQQSLYGELPTRRRRRLHLAAGEAIEQVSEQKRAGRAAELAWHFLEGDEPERALHWGLIAGNGAEEVFAHHDAELHYRTSLQLARELGDSDREVEALEKLGNVLFMLARYQEELDMLLPALQIYRKTGNKEGEMRTAAAIGWAYFEVAQRREGVDILTPVLGSWEATTRDPSPAVAALHISLGNLHWADGTGDVALPLFERGAEIAAAVGDNRLLGLAESRRAVQLQGMDRIDEALEAYDRSIDLSEMTGDLDTLSRTLNNRSLLHGFYRNDRDRARSDLERQIEVARQLAKPAQLAFALKTLGQQYWAAGDWKRAGVLFDEAAQIARRLGVSRSSEAIALAAMLRLLTGGLGSAMRELEECVTSGRERKDLDLFASAQEYLARWDLLKHRPAEARRRMGEVLKNPDLEEQRRWVPGSLLATALARVGELDQANGLVDEGLAEARRSDFPPAISQWCIATGNVRGHQCRWDEARAAFDEARTIARTGGATFFEAVALHDFALMEVLAGDHAAARARFEEELTLLRPMGALAVIELTEWELAHLD